MADKDLNRMKVMPVKQKSASEWLAEQLCRDQATTSKMVHKFEPIRTNQVLRLLYNSNSTHNA